MTGRKSWRSRRSSLGFYILDERGEPMPVRDPLVWAEWFETHPEKRHLAQTEVAGRYRVSTVFLGLDHNFYGQSKPVLWETMTFETAEREMPADALLPGFKYHESRGDQTRYTSAAAALVGHARAVAVVERWCQEQDAKAAATHHGEQK